MSCVKLEPIGAKDPNDKDSKKVENTARIW